MRIERKAIAVIKREQIPTVITDFVDDYEDYKSADQEYNNVIFRVQTIKGLVNTGIFADKQSEKDAKQFFKQLGKTDYVMIVGD